MFDNQNIADEGKFREIMKDSKLTASENLRYRIMQQIETEQALAPKKMKAKAVSFKPLLGIVAVIYILILGVIGATFLIGGVAALGSMEFMLPVIGVASIGSIYMLINVLDDKRYKS